MARFPCQDGEGSADRSRPSRQRMRGAAELLAVQGRALQARAYCCVVMPLNHTHHTRDCRGLRTPLSPGWRGRRHQLALSYAEYGSTLHDSNSDPVFAALNSASAAVNLAECDRDLMMARGAPAGAGGVDAGHAGAAEEGAEEGEAALPLAGL